MKTYMKYAAGLTALYLLVANGTKSGIVMSKAAAGGATLVHAFQGRK